MRRERRVPTFRREPCSFREDVFGVPHAEGAWPVFVLLHGRFSYFDDGGDLAVLRPD